jgi:hypothetical protein
MKPRPRRRRFRWLKRILAGLFVLVLGIGASFGIWWYKVTSAGERELQAAVAESSEIEPVLEVAELDALRQEIPKKENGALQVLVAAVWLPANPGGTVLEKIRETSPDHPLDDKLRVALETELQNAKDGMPKLLALEALPRGRYPIRWERNPIATNTDHLLKARKGANLLFCEGIRRAHHDDGEGALAACRASLNAGRSIGDEPPAIPQMVRVACQGVAFDALERILAQCSPGAESLTQTQRLWQDEADYPLLFVAMRGERAFVHTVFLRMESGEMSLEQLAEGSAANLDASFQEKLEITAFKTKLHAELKSAHAWALRDMSAMVQITRQPAHEWVPATAQLEEASRNRPLLAVLLRGTRKVLAKSGTRSQALLRCAITALAMERYRLATGHWAETLQELCPAYLREVPLDPYDGEPLRLVRLADGIVIYSLGPEAEDQGGKLNRKMRGMPGSNIGFQLWDADKRGQAGRKADK